MVVVSDTSPLRALHYLNLCALPQVLFGDVIVPPSVESELLHPAARFANVSVTEFPGLRTEIPVNQSIVLQLRVTLDSGESEATALALEHSPAFLLIDEAAGRAEAGRRGIPFTGTAGLLLRAKQAGIIPAVARLLDDLRANWGFFLTQVARMQILQLAGEQP